MVVFSHATMFTRMGRRHVIAKWKVDLLKQVNHKNSVLTNQKAAYAMFMCTFCIRVQIYNQVQICIPYANKLCPYVPRFDLKFNTF